MAGWDTYNWMRMTGYPVFMAWQATTQHWKSLRAMTDPQARLDGLLSLAASLKADFLVIDFQVAPEMLSRLR
jgi:hypothetical protein